MVTESNETPTAGVVQGRAVTAGSAGGPTVVQATVVGTGAGSAARPVMATVVTAPGQAGMGDSCGGGGGCQPPQASPGIVQGKVVGGATMAPAYGVYQQQPYGGYGDGIGIPGQEGYPAQDPTCLAFIACCCCCWCVGIIAILKSKEVNVANERGDYVAAHEKRREAMKYIYITIAIGIAADILLFIMRIAGGKEQSANGTGSGSGSGSDSGGYN